VGTVQHIEHASRPSSTAVRVRPIVESEAGAPNTAACCAYNRSTSDMFTVPSTIATAVPTRVTPRPGKKQATRYLLVACTELYTHFLLGDRSLETFKASVLTGLTGSVIVHDRYQNYDSAKLGEFSHQLCAAHILHDLANAAEVYPGTIWPEQIADALRGMIHQADLARAAGLDAIKAHVKDALLHQLRNRRGQNPPPPRSPARP
jgi:hypothetical protein